MAGAGYSRHSYSSPCSSRSPSMAQGPTHLLRQLMHLCSPQMKVCCHMLMLTFSFCSPDTSHSPPARHCALHGMRLSPLSLERSSSICRECPPTYRSQARRVTLGLSRRSVQPCKRCGLSVLLLQPDWLPCRSHVCSKRGFSKLADDPIQHCCHACISTPLIRQQSR